MPDLESIARALGGAKRSGSQWLCRCPAHDDGTPSLSIGAGDDGQLLVHCHAGCSQDAVIDAIRKRGLWPNDEAAEVLRPARPKKDRSTWKPILPAPADAPVPNHRHTRYGRPEQIAIYKDELGHLLGYVRRYRTPDGTKTFLPLLYCRNGDGRQEWRSQGFPKPLPLYRLDALADQADEPVLIVEGEKAADAAVGYFPTMAVVSWPNGAKAVDNVDWAALRGRDVTIWPDADEEGCAAARKIFEHCTRVGAHSVRLITPPADVPKGWDAADAIADPLRVDITKLLEQAAESPAQPEQAPPASLDLKRWTARAYEGPPPDREWLIKGTIPQGVPMMLAATGGLGKSYIALNLAFEIATGEHREPEIILGGPVVSYGTAVILTAEDDRKEIHRRLHALDRAGRRNIHPERLIVMPICDDIGMVHLMRDAYEGPQATDEFQRLKDQLVAIHDLRLIVFDPLQAFVGADINQAPAAGQFFCTMLNQLSAATKATTLVTHHLRKGKEMKTPADAREAIRGTTALVDGMRGVYALWNAPETQARKHMDMLGLPFGPHAVASGAVVKANYPFELRTQIYVRDEIGLLRDRSNELYDPSAGEGPLLDALVAGIRQAARERTPYTKTGKSGLYARRRQLPHMLRGRGRGHLERLAATLLETKRIGSYREKAHNKAVWLDVPGGPFATGEGTVEKRTRRR